MFIETLLSVDFPKQDERFFIFGINENHKNCLNANPQKHTRENEDIFRRLSFIYFPSFLPSPAHIRKCCKYELGGNAEKSFSERAENVKATTMKTAENFRPN